MQPQPDEAKFILRQMRGGVAPDDDDYFARAWRTARARAAQDGAVAQQPARRSCGFEARRGTLFYVLRNVGGELARLKVTPTGRLLWVE
jgi:hypothetical protein